MKSIEVRETIPKAMRHFRYNGKIEATFFSNTTIIARREYSNSIPKDQLLHYLEKGTNKIKIKLINVYDDYIAINLYISY